MAANKNKKTEYMTIGIWANPKTGHVHLAGRDKFISTVTNKKDSVRCHPHLYARLKRVLKGAGKWPPEMP